MAFQMISSQSMGRGFPSSHQISRSVHLPPRAVALGLGLDARLARSSESGVVGLESSPLVGPGVDALEEAFLDGAAELLDIQGLLLAAVSFTILEYKPPGRYGDRKSTRLNSSHSGESRMPSSA